MRSFLINLKDKIKNTRVENYIVPFYNSLLFVGRLSIGCLRTVKGSTVLIKSNGLSKKLPTVLQLPITNKCNLICKMCNVPSMKDLQDMDLGELKAALNDKSFSKIKSVGINGGEPFLKKDLENYIKALFVLPKLKYIHIISNGILTNRILEKLKIINLICKKQGVSLNVTFSIDGYGKTHDEIRGIDGAFEKTIKTIKLIQENKHLYCDNIGVICTISKYNIYNLSELDCYFKTNNLPSISYQLAVGHRRLDNESMTKDFSVIYDKHAKMMAREFFFSKYCETKNKRYYYIYEHICNDFSNRMMTCPWQEDAITIDASGNLCYCAAASDKIGSIINLDIFNQIYDKENLEYRSSIIDNKCDKCIHYSDSKAFFTSYLKACLFELKRITWSYKYLRLGGRAK